MDMGLEEGNDENNVIKLMVVMVAYLSIHQNPSSKNFKCVNCMVYDVYLNIAVI